MYALLQISNTRHHVATHSQINIISSSLNIDYNNYTVARWLLWLLTQIKQVTTLIINLEDLAVKQAHEQSGRVAGKARFSLLCSFTLSSCNCL